MNSKDFLLVHLNTEVEYKKKAYKTLVEIRSYVDTLPESHPVFKLIERHQSIDKQAAEAIKLLRLLERHSLMPGDKTPEEFVDWLVDLENKLF